MTLAKTGIHLFHNSANTCSKIVTRMYSTSFSLGIQSLHQSIQCHIYAIYGMVRYADEIVDTFHEYDKETLLNEFEEETFKAIKNGISTNPILHSFQITVNEYGIRHDYIKAFFHSMRLDIDKTKYHSTAYEEYIYGSAEVVGLMCLQVFCNGDDAYFERLVPSARALGSAFQKVNFLRDIQNDYENLGRTYFPDVDFNIFSASDKASIENDIEKDFETALEGIRNLPATSKFGVYLAYIYYRQLFNKIKRKSPVEVKSARIRINDARKVSLLFKCYFSVKLNLV